MPSQAAHAPGSTTSSLLRFARRARRQPRAARDRRSTCAPPRQGGPGPQGRRASTRRPRRSSRRSAPADTNADQDVRAAPRRSQGADAAGGRSRSRCSARSWRRATKALVAELLSAILGPDPLRRRSVRAWRRAALGRRDKVDPRSGPRLLRNGDRGPGRGAFGIAVRSDLRGRQGAARRPGRARRAPAINRRHPSIKSSTRAHHPGAASSASLVAMVRGTHDRALARRRHDGRRRRLGVPRVAEVPLDHPPYAVLAEVERLRSARRSAA